MASMGGDCDAAPGASAGVQTQEGIHPAVLPARETQRRVEHREADAVLIRQRPGRVVIVAAPEREIARVIGAPVIAEPALENQRHFIAAVSVIGYHAACAYAVKG